MAAPGSRHRHSFPMRLQQILSGSRAVSPALRLEAETPPKVKAFIDRVINIPLADIAIPLSGFRWEFNKGNFHHWKSLFMHFDTYFKKYVSDRRDLLLSDDFLEEDPFPKNTVLQILRVMQCILENCHNKASFNGLEHLGLLLASTDPEVIVATLETLSALVKINPSKVHVSGKLINCGSMNSHLLSLAQGWGSKEEGLGLYSCVVANERNQHEGLSLFPAEIENKCDGTQYRLGSTLHFEYNSGTAGGPDQANQNSKSSMCVIRIPDIHQRKEDELSILRQLIEQFSVPKELRFSLLTRIRYARAFSSAKTSRLYSRISLLAFNVLVQSNDANDELGSFFTNEPEYTNELIRLVRAEEFVPGSIRAAAMFALGALLAAYASCHERARALCGSNNISSGGNRMVLLGVLQKAIMSLSNPSDPSAPLYVDALLQFFLLHVLSSSSSGSAIRGSAIVAPLLPLLQDSDPAHINLVCLGVKTLQKLMEYSSPAVTLFKDLGGVEILTQRLHSDVQRVVGTSDESSSAMLIGDAVRSDEDNVYPQKRLIKTLLKALGSATYSPANSTRSQNSSNNLLPISLSTIFSNVDKFGGDIYFSAVTLMSEIIHKDPTCYPALKELGLPDAFLSSVCAGILPSSKALICVPNGLGAICLNNGGLEAVRDTSAMRFLVDTFTSRKYVIVMNEGVVLLANAVEELLRHVSSLRATGVDIVIEILSKLSSGVDQGKNIPKRSNESMDMETDAENKDTERQDFSAADSNMEGISDEQFLHLSIFHVMVLIHRLMENSETCRLFVEKGGLESLLKILLQPSIAQSSEGMPIALHSTMVFKAFTQHHSAPLARAFSSALREYMKKALSELESVSSSCTTAPSITMSSEALRSVFIVEFLLFLAASKDNRWMNALLLEFGDASKDVLEDIGCVHRKVLWQISLIEDMKLYRDSDSSPSSDGQRIDQPSSDFDENRLSSFRQYLDPLLRRRGSGWSIESQISDIINMYRDIGQATSGSQRGVNRSSNLITASSTQDPSASSSDSNANSNSEESKRRSDYLSCRDMMKSLSDHINHLFMELGKAMLLSSRRENTVMNVPSSVASVASTVGSIILGHLNYEQHINQAEKSALVITKCRYLGRVVDFIDGILLDRPESCNPIMLNAIYCHGVIHAILTSFEATSELLFAVNRPPASPMETDNKPEMEEKEETDLSWIYGPLASFGALMDRLVNSTFILSTSTRQLLEQPVCSTTVTFPPDAEGFVKLLQSKVLKAVLPIWCNPHFAESNLDFISAVTSILRHVYSGVDVKNISGNTAARFPGPPPDENSISLIVEMGFSRARAEEALRQVGTNSVEIATDWLFSHPEEPQEDDELARALAMSLGNSDGSSKESTSADAPNSTVKELEEEMVQFPSLDEFLVSCIKLLHAKDSLAFSLRSLLVTICSQNDGQNRIKVLTYLIDHVKQFSATSSSTNEAVLSALFHLLALILHDDAAARTVACSAGLVNVSLDLLSGLDMEPNDNNCIEVPKWVMPCFLSVDQMMQTQPRLPDISELDFTATDSKKVQTPVMIDENKKHESAEGFLGMDYQKRLVEVCCRCIKKHVPSDAMHAVLQLCATLTKNHAVAISFFEHGGFHALLSLPMSSYFRGFNNIASTIIRHILEDPQTLQQAMELEIRHSLLAAANRTSSSRVSPRNFVQSLTSVIRRDPVVFMKAAHAVCQLEMVGDRSYVTLLPLSKDRDKDKCKDKEKEKIPEKEKAADGKVSGDGSGATVLSKQSDTAAKNVKQQKKSPQSFVSVIEHLLDLVVAFYPPLKLDDQSSATTSDMDIDSTSSKGKGKALAVSSEDSKVAGQEIYASVAKGTFILKLLTDIILTYAPSIHVVLRRDADLSSSRAPLQAIPGVNSGGLFHHIIHNYLPDASKQKKEKKTDGDWRQKLATRANQFLVSSSIRSAEGRKRIFSEISSTFVSFVEPSNDCKVPDSSISADVDLLNDILSARSSTGSSMSAEASVTFVDAGLFQSITRALQVLDLDHSDSVKVATGMVKALELVSKEHVHSVDLNAKGNTKSTSDDRSQSLVQPDHPEALSDQRDTQITVQASVGFDSLEDDMEHDRDLDGSFAREGEDNYMHEASEDGVGNENGISTVEIRFDIPRNVEDDDMGDDDDDEDDEEEENDDMSADEREEVEEEDEDDEENNDLEEGDHPMSHPDTDQDDHEMDEEFDEDIFDEEDEDEDEDGVILRLEEGFNGINVFDQIEVFSGNNNISNETLRVMPLDIFGTRRPGRTTSLYNLLGRTGNSENLQHPLLEEPSTTRQLGHQATPENIVDAAFADRSSENSSRVDAIFRTLRTGRPGHRFNLWLDEGRPSGSSAPASAPQGIEDLLISQLRRTSEQAPEQNVSAGAPQENGDLGQLRPEAETGEEMQATLGETNDTGAVPSSRPGVNGSDIVGVAPDGDSLHVDASTANDLASDMQFERSDVAVRDVEAVSQASSGSGATLGESLRSLEVEIGSVEGHDDAERHVSSDRLPLGDVQVSARSRRPVNTVHVNNRDTSLERVSEVPQNPTQEANQSETEEGQGPNQNLASDAIDPTFLEALPEDLRAEVLSTRQNQEGQASNERSQSDGDIDPEFLAALPPDIREEVLAQQRAQRLQNSQELEGQPVEMDAVSIIATFPSEIREEVLLTSPDTLLATLTPALVAEANMLRERFAHRYSSGLGLFGMSARHRRGESSRHGEPSAGDVGTRQSTSKPIEADGAPLLDKDALKWLLRVLRIVQPVYKPLLLKLLLNLCAHRETRMALVQILVDVLMLDLQSSNKRPVNEAESPYRLFNCQNNITYSRPQHANGVPPLLSRRVLETLTFLAKNHANVAKLLLYLELPLPSAPHDQRGKAIATEDHLNKDQQVYAISLLLTLLNQPLYMRSVTHLEQLLNLLEVIMLNADSEVNQPEKSEASSEKPDGSDSAMQDAQNNANVGGASVSGSPVPDKNCTSAAKVENNLHTVLESLPQAELRLLCSLLAHDGLSENAYSLLGEVLKKIVALAPSLCSLFIMELTHSMQSLTSCAMVELQLKDETEKALLGTSSTNGTAILRVLQSLSSLVTTLQDKKDLHVMSEKDQNDALGQISEINGSLEPLWLELSNCISKIESYSEYQPDLTALNASPSAGAASPLPAGAQNILPYIESFFVTSEKLRPGPTEAVQEYAASTSSDMEDASTSSVGQKSLASYSSFDEKYNVFVKFSEKHRRLLNIFIRQNPSLLEKSFALMLKIPRLIEFDNKRSYFRSKIKHQHDHHHSPIRISVRRSYILEDSYNQLRMRTPQELKGRINVHFQGEEGIDAGGLTREWYQLLSRVIFDKNALLFTTVGNESTFQPNPNSVYQTEHLSYFKFVGRVVGKALFDAQLLDVHFTRSFYKHILGVKVTYHDIEAIDPGYYKNLKWMLENDISDILDLTFSMDADEEKLILYEKAEVTDLELIPGGRNIRVTEENKHEYVNRVAEHRLTTAIRPQINAFMEGFNEMIPRDLISIFNDKELELLISGLPDIDLDDLKANTEYSGYTVASPIIQWFWEAVYDFSKEDKARFLQFVTGTSKVPLEGFSALQGISGPQRFQIHKAYGSIQHLPSAHTCFNQLDLPEYTTKDQLQERLLMAIHEGNEGFGFG